MNKTKSINNHKFQLDMSGIEVKEAEGDDGALVIKGYANTTAKDRMGDVIKKEAWEKGGLDNYLKNPIVLAYHNPSKPIGEVTEYSINSKGLKVVAEISKAAGDVYEFVKSGILKTFSIGFMVKDADYDQKTDIFIIKDLELFEISVVSIPANADSVFSVSKSFDNKDEYLKFKQQYSNEEEETKTIVKVPETTVTKEKKIVEDDNNLSLTPEELEIANKKAVDTYIAEKAAEEAKKAEITATAVTAGETGAERLIKELESRITEKDNSMEVALEGLRTELAEKATELKAIQESKIQFNPDKKSGDVTEKEIDSAVLASIIMGKGLQETEFFKGLVTKTGDHLASVTADWENLFNTSLYQDIQKKTIIEPLFSNNIAMNSRTMTFPWNPEAGYAAWVADSAYKTSASGGAAKEQLIQDNTIKAEKMATKEYLGYEEEEDAIIAILPIIRAAIVRRMVKSTDQELLLGGVGDTYNSGSGLIDGISTLASDINSGADYNYVQPGAFGDPTTIADLQQTRRLMGTPGLMPGGIVYVVSEAIMYDLMEDPDFRTVDLVGDRATILRGQVGSVNGSPVVVSDAFENDAVDKVQGIAFNSSNYLFGTLRGMMVERDKDIEYQRHVLVATRRFGLTEIVPALAVATKRQSYCTNLVRAAS